MNLRSNTKSLNRVTFASLLVALGIIYGDIGTSPLYVLKAIAGEKIIDEVLIYGAVSCIFWTLVFQTTVKYIWLTLKADNEGEGGIFSLYALVRRYGKKLVIPAILGATALLADGIITPPISVASAVEGFTMVIPGMPTVPVIIVILSLLFFFQRFGTQKIGSFFGPVMFLWFAMLFTIGLSQVYLHPEVLKALDPRYGFSLLVKYPHGFWLLGAVFLATTGAEALYSDMGHCGKKNIRITWVFVKICLVVNYMGQAAWTLHQGGMVMNGRNPFFEMMPSWFLLAGICIATVATIIASQALISGSYTLINEAMSMNFWPRVRVKQPTELKGQIYIPSVNNMLWFGCILMILYFRSSSHMEAAYGFSITIAMMMTTILLCYFLRFRMKWNKYAVLCLFTLFAVIEIAFFTANVAKIKERWMFLFFELFIFMTMYVCYYARKINNRFTKFTQIGKYTSQLKALSNDQGIHLYATHLVYLTKANNRSEIEEKIMRSIFAKRPKRAEVYWFLHVHRTEHPYTLSYSISELLDEKIFKVTINTGFRIQPRIELYFKKIISDMLEQKELQPAIFNDRYNYSTGPDFKFIVIEKFISVENAFNFREGLLLRAFYFLKNLSQSDVKAFGLDKSDVEIEHVPIVYHPVPAVILEREV